MCVVCSSFLFIILTLHLGKEAGEAYLKAAKLYKTTPEFRFECSKAFENASKCLKRMDAKGDLRT